ncbi:type II CRISPR RNA-guided endonuclease Cas9 [Chryseobacterium sp. SIMBA_028]|uniref:type II CRISPR RNA-guided endonuclease Cas9 n=1 Tax=Chryseobacterium sp. SIMBA_028 TaxID=3085771 RepID=UPI00397A5ADF
MIKNILGLDVGISSVGAAVIKEENGTLSVEKLSVRIVPEDPDFHGKFYSGNTASKNFDRTIKRGIRRDNQRFKARRDKLYQTLRENNMFPTDNLFNISANELYGLRAKAVSEQISLEELGRVFILLNQRRGFLSNRKSISEEENSTEYKERIATLEKKLAGRTIGQKLYSELQYNKNTFEVLLRERTYQRSSYIEEFNRIWDEQKKYYSVLTGGINEDDNKGMLYDIIHNRIIYYQRPLKSQKNLISECSFEKYHKATVKSSPYFELFRIWSKVNDLSWKTPSGETFKPTPEQKQKLKDALWNGENLNAKYKLSITEIKKLLGYGRNEKIYLNFTELDGSRTYVILKKALEEAGIENTKQYLFFNLDVNDEKGGLFELWHITYSLSTEKEVVNALKSRFEFSENQSEIIAKKVGYPSDYGSLSTRAIRKLLPHLEKGLGYSEACDEVGYDHSGYKTKIELKPNLKQLKKNELRNPVVEQILNQVVNIVNLVIEKYGKIDEIRVELARELRNSAKTRKNIFQANSKNKKNNDAIRKKLIEEYEFKLVNGRDVKRYILWEETIHECLYCNNPINGTDMLTGNADLEHILPKSRSFSNAMNNYIIAHRKCNSNKGQKTAYDFMESIGEEALSQYVEKVNALYNDGKGSISKSKFDNLLCKGEDIPSDFVERMKKDSQYIAKEAVKMLKTVCPNVYTTTGQVTDFLREEWELKNLLEELTFDKYKAIGQVEKKTIKTNNGQTKTFETITDWSKRDDHRHHAVDALICALTDQKIIFKLNNLNKIYQYERNALSQKEIEEIEEFLEGKFSLKEFSAQRGNVIECSIENIRKEAKKHLEEIFISFKKENSKVLSKNINAPKNVEPKITWVPRARLHEDTVMGRVKRISEKKMKLSDKVSMEEIEMIVNPKIKETLYQHIAKFDNHLKIAFAVKTLKSEPISYKGNEVKEVDVYEWANTKRVDIESFLTDNQKTKSAKDKFIENVLKSDRGIGILLEKRLKEFNGDYKEAFKNLFENPIITKNGMTVKNVTIYDESKVERVRNGYAKTGGNHHALIYKDENGKYNDRVVSFWEAVEIGLLNIAEHNNPYPIIYRNDNYELGIFQFSIQINDLFVFDLKHSDNPQEENEIDFFDVKNKKLISNKLFRVQKMSKKSNGTFDIHFRHHLETSINRNIKEMTWINIQSNSYLERLIKIRVNHLGDIVKIGE